MVVLSEYVKAKHKATFDFSNFQISTLLRKSFKKNRVEKGEKKFSTHVKNGIFQKVYKAKPKQDLPRFTDNPIQSNVNPLSFLMYAIFFYKKLDSLGKNGNLKHRQIRV